MTLIIALSTTENLWLQLYEVISVQKLQCVVLSWLLRISNHYNSFRNHMKLLTEKFPKIVDSKIYNLWSTIIGAVVITTTNTL